METSIDWERYFGRFSGWIFALAPMIFVLLPFFWVYSFLRLLFGLGWILVDCCKGKINRVSLFKEFFEGREIKTVEDDNKEEQWDN